MNNKLSMLACAALAAFSMSTTAQAETNWSGGVAVVNNYLDRGYSLSDHRPAVQAELGYGTELGLHADLFTSSVHDGVQYGQEFQFKAGLARETAGVSWDLFVNQHVYTGFEDTDANYWEVQMDVSRPIGPLTPVVSFVGSPDGYGAWGGYGFVGVESGYELPRGFALTAAAGRMMFTGDDPDQGDYTFVAGGVDWTHRTGVQLSFGVEVGGTRDQVHPTFRLGRAF